MTEIKVNKILKFVIELTEAQAELIKYEYNLLVAIQNRDEKYVEDRGFKSIDDVRENYSAFRLYPHLLKIVSEIER